jgi:cytochrome c553
MQKTLLLTIVCLGVNLLAAPREVCAQTSPSFNRDIRPLLAAKCFACHGPDEAHREADLRLDVREVAIDTGAIVPGNIDKSDIVRRIFSNDPDEQMPPADAPETLTDAQKKLIRRWIADGAKYEKHWAFVPPQRPPLPKVKNSKWPRNEIDRFVLARLETEGLNPSAEADRYTLVRRVHLDLVGLPPTPEEADAFAHSNDPRAYEKLVEQLLDSKHYGERWARQWLDLARYSDTNGYEKDRPRSIWPYRDWVIRALNNDMPFDRFSIEQLAGDMLPAATEAQKIATGFHRNTMLNEEGGIDPLEYRFYAMVDRVATTGTVWMGLTTGCAQCHTHKYDPISHTDYYRLMALLNNAEEPDLSIQQPSIADRRRRIAEQIAKLEADLPNQFPPAPGDGPIEARRRKTIEGKYSDWLKAQRERAVVWKTLRPFHSESNLPKLEVLQDGSIFSSGDITKRDVYTLKFHLDESSLPLTALRLEVLPDARLPAGGPGRAFYEGRKGDFFLSEVVAQLNERPLKFASASHSFGKISIGSGNANATNVFDETGSTGWATAGREGEAHQLVLNLQKPIDTSGELQIELIFERHFAASLGRFRFSGTSATKLVKATQLPAEVEQLLAQDEKPLTAKELSQLKRRFVLSTPELAKARGPIDKLRKSLPAFPTTMVMLERPADNLRKTYRHHRGEFLSPREKVTGGVPAVFRQLPDGQPVNRLTFARWLVSDRNPLVGRVTVNRAWRAFFGAGLIRTSGDFGTQSEPPTHPQLLDWLAREFVDGGWSLKKLHRLIVASATYRQSSHIAPELLRRDPANRLFARGPRYRVDGETVRDIMLKASGLLSKTMHGPGVYPPQPASVTALAYGNSKWTPSAGEERFRRSLYTFSKRTAPFAAYTIFDAPTGEICTARRNRSNTPLQALTLLNAEMYLEMSRTLAKRATREPEREDVATVIFRRFLTRPPQPEELSALLEFQQAQQERLEQGELSATAITGDKQATAEFAAWVMLSRAVMNLDEAITKP